MKDQLQDVDRDSVIVISTTERGKKISKPLQTQNIDVDHVTINHPRKLTRLGKLSYRKDHDLVIVDSFGLALLVAKIISLLFTVPLAFRVRGNGYREYVEEIKLGLLERSVSQVAYSILKYIISRLLVRYVDGFIYVSDWLRTETRKYHSNDKPQLVVHTPCDWVNTSTSETTRDKQENINILMVTNFDYWKKVEPIEEALPELSRVATNNDIEFNIVGDGKYLKYFRKANEYDSVNFVGYTENIKNEFESADVFIHLSYHDGYPSVVLEAAVSGCAIIVNDYPGMREQVSDGINGKIVSMEEKKELERAIYRLRDCKKLRERLGHNARERVKHQNTNKQIGTELSTAIQWIIERDI